MRVVATSSESPAATTLPLSNRAVRRFLRNRAAVAALAFIVVLAIAALAAPWVAPFASNAREYSFLSPSARHWLGTDANGYDVFSRVLFGARLSLVAACVSIALAILVGAPLGLASGYAGGFVDALLMRGIDMLLSFPGILIAFLCAAMYRESWAAVIIAVAMINLPLFARQVRATVLTIRQLDYVTAARAMGGSHAYIVLRVIAPATVHTIAVLAALGLGAAILEVAGLSFLGISGDVGVPEWGNMLNEAKGHVTRSFWPVLGPGVVISLSVLAFNLVGDGLRDLLDTRER